MALIASVAAGLPQPIRAALAAAEIETELEAVRIGRGDSLSVLLGKAGVSAGDAYRISKAIQRKTDLRRMRIGREVRFLFGVDGGRRHTALAVSVETGQGRFVEANRTADGGYKARRTAHPLTRPIPLSAIAFDRDDRTVTVRRNETIGGILQRHGVDGQTMRAVVRALRAEFDPRDLKPGHAISIAAGLDGEGTPLLRGIALHLDGDRAVAVVRTDGGSFAARSTTDAALRTAGRAPVAAAAEDTAAPPPAPPPAPPRAADGADRSDRGPVQIATPAAPEPLPPATEHSITVRSGDTLMAILRRHGIDRVEADRAIQAARDKINLRQLRIGQKITLVTGTDETGADTLEAVALHVGGDRFVKVTRAAGGLFEAAQVSRRALAEAPLWHPATAGAPPDETQRRDPAGVTGADGRGQVMNGAFVAAAAPIAASTPGAATAGGVHGTVNGVADRYVNGHANGYVNGHADGDDGLVRKSVVISKGDTLSVALTRAGGTRAEAEAAIVAFRTVHNPRRLRIGQTLSLSFEPANGSNGAYRLASLALDVAPDRDVVITRGNDGIFVPSVVDRPLYRILERKIGAVDTNLHDAALAAKMPRQALAEMVHIFSYDVDFQRDIQPGNRFEVLYEAAYDMAGEFVENGPVLYARLEAGERSLELFRYEPDDEPADYLDAQGASVRKELMRTPISGARLSSGFGPRRHPILGYTKKHLGLDFAAPTGTPVFAAGDGTITRVGRAGNYGKYIRIRHKGIYNTGYAHLNGYANGMKRGKRVRQGQVIGYVGSTGMSTGPHLHYEVMRGEKRINPMTLKLPTGRKLAGGELAVFQEQVQKITVLLAEVPALTRVAQR